jgi:hypothetical protein
VERVHPGLSGCATRAVRIEAAKSALTVEDVENA